MDPIEKSAVGLVARQAIAQHEKQRAALAGHPLCGDDCDGCAAYEAKP